MSDAYVPPLQRDPKRPFWDVEAQTMTREQLRAVQNERLVDAVHRVYEQAPFFRHRFDEAGVSPDDVKSVDDIGKLPILFKDDLRQDEIAHPPIGQYRCVGLEGSVRFATSTGTTGKPTIALWTQNDLVLDYELSARASWRLGLRPGMVVVNAHPGYLNGGESFIAGDTRHMGMLPISLGPPESFEDAARALRAIEGIHVDHWRLFPAAVVRFREAAEEHGINVDLPAPEEAGPLQQYDKMSVGQECILVLGGTCKPGSGRGGHLCEDYAVIEVLDEETLRPVSEGERGLLTVTSLGRDNPLIRYNNEDVVRIESEPCECGETHRRGFWEGRRKDIVRVQGKPILPIDVWFELPVHAEYGLVRRPSADRLTVRVEHQPAADLAERLEARTGVPVDVEVVPEGTLPRAAFKPSRVIDED
jgi:phenylacetate-CoA ligase